VWKSSGHVIGIRGSGEVREMATGTVGWHTLEAVPRVARIASQSLVHAGEGEIRITGVIKARDLPAVRRVAGFASRREACGDVIDHTVLLKIARMATDALGAEPDVLPDRGASVTRITRKRRMSAQQRETVPMILNGAGIHAPAEYGVAALALSAKLALVEIRMAIRATSSGFCEDLRYMTGTTGDILVHAAKLKAAFGVVIEFESRAKRGPTGGGVAVLAWKRKFPVRVGRSDLRERR
jgi:hypothetical protein